MIPRDSLRDIVDVDGIIDRCLDAGDRLDAHPLQQSGEEINTLDSDLCHVLMRWLQRRGVEVR